MLLNFSFLSPAFGAAPPEQKTLFVQVKDTALRAEPKFWSTSLSKLPYGSALTPLSTSGENASWVKVKFNELEGFVHLSSVTKRKVVFNATTNAPAHGVDTSTIVLAGKGFNRQVEGSFASAKGVSYAPVDTVEGYTVNSDAFAKFLLDGGLNDK